MLELLICSSMQVIKPSLKICLSRQSRIHIPDSLSGNQYFIATRAFFQQHRDVTFAYLADRLISEILGIQGNHSHFPRG
jgi:hypothetical protein